MLRNLPGLLHGMKNSLLRARSTVIRFTLIGATAFATLPGHAQDTTLFYGFLSDGPNLSLVTVDHHTAAYETVASMEDVTDVDQEFVLVRGLQHSVFIFGKDMFGLPNFFDIDLKTGDVMHKITPAIGLDLTLPRHNSNSDEAIALELEMPARIVSLEYASGNVFAIDTIAAIDTAYAATFKASTNEYVFIARHHGDPPYSYRYYRYDLDAKTLLGGEMIDITEPYSLQMLYWDEVTDFVFAARIDEMDGNNQYVNLNENGDISLISYFMQSLTLYPHTQAINAKERLWVYQGQHISEPAGTYTIFTHNMNTGDQLSVAHTQTPLLAMFSADTGAPLSVYAPHEEMPFKVFPVPAQSQLRFSLPLSQACVSDMSGRVLLQSASTKAMERMDVSKLAPGSYLLHGNRNGKIQVIRFVKQ